MISDRAREGVSDKESHKAREGGAAQDRGYIDPTGQCVEQVELHRELRLAAFFSVKVSHFIKSVAPMGFNPGKLQGGGVGLKSVEQVLVKGGDAYRGGPGGTAKPGEVRPPIVFKGE